MNEEWQESGLCFDFSKAKSVISLDNHGRGHGLSHILKAVDFVVEWDHEFWLIEAKNPEDPTIPLRHQHNAEKKFSEKIQSRTLIHSELFPKFIDSLLFLALDRGIPTKPMRCMALIALESLTHIDCLTLSAAITGLHDGCLEGPPKRGWSKGFAVHLFNLELWNRAWPQCRVTRMQR
ncbi:MAG: hypothetical protein HQM06_08255 [Magnetococcales bacterium]|nr:hypothetical protein [Magnetococcales bacterium]